MGWGWTDWGAALLRKPWGCWWVCGKLNVNQQYALAARTSNSNQNCINRQIAPSLRKIIILSFSVLIRLHPGTVSNFQFCSTRKVSISCSKVSRDPWDSGGWRLWSFFPGDIQKLPGHWPREQALGGPAWAGGLTRWYPEVPANLSHSVILWTRELQRSFHPKWSWDPKKHYSRRATLI